MKAPCPCDLSAEAKDKWRENTTRGHGPAGPDQKSKFRHPGRSKPGQQQLEPEQSGRCQLQALRKRGINSTSKSSVELMEDLEMAKEITAELVRLMFDYDAQTGHLIHRQNQGRAKRGERAGTLKPTGYRVISVQRRFFQSARVVWLHQYGSWPTHQVDHINHVRDDDRLENLRDVTPQQNLHNLSARRKNNSSGVQGVHWNTREGKWYAVIYAAGKGIFLGSYVLFEDAVLARVEGKKKYHFQLT